MRVDGALYIGAAAVALPGGRQHFGHVIDHRANGIDSAPESVTTILPVAEAGQTAISLALAAGAEALAEAGVAAADLGLLTHSWIFDPSPDDCTAAPRLARLLGAKNAVAVGMRQMSNGGAIAAQMVAAQMLAEPRIAHGLVVTADVHGPEAMWRWQPQVGTALGDGATALLLSRGSGSLAIVSIASGSVPEEEQWWAERDPDGRVTLPPNVFRTRRCVRRTLESVLADAGLTKDDPRLVLTLMPRLDLSFIDSLFYGQIPANEIVELAGETGHLFAGDLAANLNYLRTERRLAPGEYALVINIGVGMTVTMLVVRGEREE